MRIRTRPLPPIDQRPWTQEECLDGLRRYYPSNEYALFPQVRSAAGFDAKRTADAVMMSLWPSRGLMVHGFEIKSSMHDLRRELEQPEKAEAIAKFCDHWWIVTGSVDIVPDPDALPATWGWLARVGNELKLQRPAQTLQPEPLTRTFLAAVLRQAQAWTPGEQQMRDAVKAAVDECNRTRDEAEDAEAERRRKNYGDLHDTVKEFNRLTGMDIDQYSKPEHEAAKLRLAMKLVGEMTDGYPTLRRLREILSENAADMKKRADAMETFLDSIVAP